VLLLELVMLGLLEDQLNNKHTKIKIKQQIMKINKLKQIIKEELRAILAEKSPEVAPAPTKPKTKEEEKKKNPLHPNPNTNPNTRPKAKSTEVAPAPTKPKTKEEEKKKNPLHPNPNTNPNTRPKAKANEAVSKGIADIVKRYKLLKKK